jgi:hypothetical protein
MLYEAGGRGCLCISRHASAPEIAYVHFKSTDVSYRKVRMDETETLLFIPDDTSNGCKSYCFGFGVSRSVLRISLLMVLRFFVVFTANDRRHSTRQLSAIR